MGRAYTSAEVQSVYSTAPADLANIGPDLLMVIMVSSIQSTGM